MTATTDAKPLDELESAINRVLLDVVSPTNRDKYHFGGCLRWGLIERELNEAVAATITTLRADLERAERDCAHWKANHDHIKERIRVLLDRPDLPKPRKHVLDYFDGVIAQKDAALERANDELKTLREESEWHKDLRIDFPFLQQANGQTVDWDWIDEHRPPATAKEDV